MTNTIKQYDSMRKAAVVFEWESRCERYGNPYEVLSLNLSADNYGYTNWDAIFALAEGLLDRERWQVHGDDNLADDDVAAFHEEFLEYLKKRLNGEDPLEERREAHRKWIEEQKAAGVVFHSTTDVGVVMREQAINIIGIIEDDNND